MDAITLVGLLIYVLAFWAISSRYPAVALALVFGLAPFQNNLSGGIGGMRFSIAEVNLVLSLPILGLALLRNDKPLRSWPFLWTCGAYFAVCVASAFVLWRGGSALDSLFQMTLFFFILIPVFSIVARRPEDLMPALWTLLGVATFLASIVLITRSQYILGIHKNGIGGSLGCAFLVAFELWFHYRSKNSWHKNVVLALLIVIASGLIVTVSRGAWIGTVAGMIFITAMRRQFNLLGRLALVMVPVLALGWMLLPPETRDYAFDFNPERGNIEARVNNQDMAIKMIEQNPILGAGIGVRKDFDATQLVLFTLAETGVLGMITLTLVFTSFFGMVWRTQKRLARTEFSYSLLAIGGALMLARIGHGMVDHYWARGPTMMGWAAAGMATGVYLYGPKNSYVKRMQRARALLAVHLLEMLRRGKRGQSAPALSRAELQIANDALALVAARPDEALAPGQRPRNSKEARARDPLSELANQVGQL